ncbi:MAG: AraC family ligand binding domain-containing protein [Myxococcales bacterium]
MVVFIARLDAVRLRRVVARRCQSLARGGQAGRSRVRVGGAMARHIDVDEARADAFGLAEELAPFASEPHAHRKHQLLYASEGSLRLRTDEREWLLPPQRAALLPAGVPHAVSATRPVSLRTVYLAPRFLSAPPASAVVFAVTPLARELVLHAMRWTADVPLDARGERFFAAVGALCEEWLEAPLPFSLPVARTPELQAAMEHVLANVGGRVTPAAAARALVTRAKDRAHWHRVLSEFACKAAAGEHQGRNALRARRDLRVSSEISLRHSANSRKRWSTK